SQRCGLAQQARAVFGTTGWARQAMPNYGTYAVSKAGLEAMVRIYAGEVARTRLRVNVIHPGIVRTRLRARIFPGENPANLPSPETIADAFLPLVLKECSRHGEIVAAADLVG